MQVPSAALMIGLVRSCCACKNVSVSVFAQAQAVLRAAIEESFFWSLQRLPRHWHCVRLLRSHYLWPFDLPLLLRALRPVRWNECCSMRAGRLTLQFPVVAEGVHCSPVGDLEDIRLSREVVGGFWQGGLARLFCWPSSRSWCQRSEREFIRRPTPPMS